MVCHLHQPTHILVDEAVWSILPLPCLSGLMGAVTYPRSTYCKSDPYVHQWMLQPSGLTPNNPNQACISSSFLYVLWALPGSSHIPSSSCAHSWVLQFNSAHPVCRSGRQASRRVLQPSKSAHSSSTRPAPSPRSCACKGLLRSSSLA